MKLFRNLRAKNVAWNCEINYNFERKVQIFDMMVSERDRLNEMAEIPTNFIEKFEIGDVTVKNKRGEFRIELCDEEICLIQVNEYEKLKYFSCAEDNFDIAEKALKLYFKELEKKVMKNNNRKEKNLNLLDKELNV